MKKIFALVMTVAILMVAAAPSFAQGRDRRCNNDSRARAAQTYRSRNSQTYYDNSRSSYYDYQQYDNRSFWEKHRDKLTVAAGTAGGAALGGLIGGKKGAVIGALSGLGGSALYTYKIRR
jgi:hypothetical protein